MSGVSRNNCCETCGKCRNIPQKTPMDEFSKMNFLTRQMLSQNVCPNFLQIKEIFHKVTIDYRFVLFEVLIFIIIFRNSQRFE